MILALGQWLWQMILVNDIGPCFLQTIPLRTTDYSKGGKNQTKIKAKIHLQGIWEWFSCGLISQWSLISWFHWPCRSINTRFPLFWKISEIHLQYYCKPLLCSLMRQLSQGGLSKLFSWWAQCKEERKIAMEHHSGGIKLPLNWLPHFIGGRIQEVISFQIRAKEEE